MTVSKEEYRRTLTSIKVAFVMLTILFFAILISFMILLVNVRNLSHKAVKLTLQNNYLVHQNSLRIKEDQTTRIKSCEKGYTGIGEVFEIFFPKKPTEQQKENFKKFNNRIEQLKRNCSKTYSGK